MWFIPWTIAAFLAFLAGSVPFGLLIARAKGVDIRTVGSGNIGATNVGRALGRRYFFLCFALDFVKGFGPVLGVGVVFGLFEPPMVEPSRALPWLMCMAAPVLGHMFSPWLAFKGGKGVATSLGAMLAVWPFLTMPALGVLLVFGVVLATTRYVSLASMTAGLSLPLWTACLWAMWAGGNVAGVGAAREGVVWRQGVPFLVVGAALALLVVWAHRANIGRLRAGTEPRVGSRRTPMDTTPSKTPTPTTTP